MMRPLSQYIPAMAPPQARGFAYAAAASASCCWCCVSYVLTVTNLVST